MDKYYVSHEEVSRAVTLMARRINTWAADRGKNGLLKVFPVPRGGVPITYMLQGQLPILVVDSVFDADLIVDDLIDSGATKERYVNLDHPSVAPLDAPPFFNAFTKKYVEDGIYLPENHWAVFPWEDGDQDTSADDIVVRLLQFIGEDPARGGLVETPQRVLRAWQHWAGGYQKDPADVLKTFDDGAEKCDEMILVRDIPFYSQCEHHLAPFFGTAHIGYIPNGRIVGLSKLSRLLDIFARRLQVQERLTNQVADALAEHLEPLGVGVVIQARHLCMESRGICQQGHSTITSAMRGALLDNPAARSEFMSLVGVS